MTPEKYLGASSLPLIKAKLDAGLATKQDTLVSGTSIKTVNGQSILGSGDIEIVDKLYSAYGQNEDGAVTQKFFTEKVQALESASSEAAGDIEAIEEMLEGTVQVDTKLGTTGTDSTVTLVKTTAALNNLSSTTDTDIALPVASSTVAGVINPATYDTIYDTADALEAIEGAAVAVTGLSATADQSALTAAWKQATGKDTLINGARILDVDNGKTWTYYSNTTTWYAQDNTNPTIEINAFTNEAAGTILGDATTDGKIYAESDGTGSVNGWDTVKNDISTNKSGIAAINETLGGLDAKYDAKYGTLTEQQQLRSDVEDVMGEIAELGADKQDKLVSGTNIKTVNNTTLLGSGNLSVQEVLVSGTNIKTVNSQSILGAGNIQIDVPQALTAGEFEAAWSGTNA